MLLNYTSKKELKASIGKTLNYQETSMFGPEYKENGTFTGARRPHLQGGGREFFASVTMLNGLIKSVK
tara:strand:+ start:1418 stop:1621 length:204 start_codon:yes stop_codon:yes gene_type:complete